MMYWIGLYGLASLANVACNYTYRREKDWLKLGLLPLLLLIYLSRTQTDWGIILAISLSWLGDIFLIREDRFFIPGLVSFLLAHLSYLAVM